MDEGDLKTFEENVKRPKQMNEGITRTDDDARKTKRFRQANSPPKHFPCLINQLRLTLQRKGCVRESQAASRPTLLPSLFDTGFKHFVPCNVTLKLHQTRTSIPVISKTCYVCVCVHVYIYTVN
jgi:hypothetical protein